MKIGWLIAIIAFGTICASAQSKPADEPEVVAAVAPFFPAVAAAAKASGDVIVDVTIDSRGTVSDARAAAGHTLLKKICEVTAKRWKFIPAKGEETKRTASLSFSFRVLDKSAAEFDMTPVFLPPYRIEITTVKPKIETVTVH